MMINPIIASHFTPNRSNSFPTIGLNKPINRAPGNINKPDSKAVKPLAFCKYSGNKIISAYMTNVTVQLIIVVKENIL